MSTKTYRIRSYLVWGILLSICLALFLIYSRLPIDGATGDMESFSAHGFRIQWLLEHFILDNIQLKMDCQPNKYIINADPLRLQQAFMNLYLNARDAMPTGVRLHFGLDRFTLEPGNRPPYPDLFPGDWICVCIQDTEVGIPANALPHIFDPFFTTKPVGLRTGLGLAQTYRIIKQHGENIGIQSQEGEGTKFSLYFPALET